MDVEWVISQHAKERLAERIGRPFDPAQFKPTDEGVDGLRLWLDENGAGVLVREDLGTGWARFLVVTAYSPAFVDANRVRGRLRPLPLSLKHTEVAVPALEPRARHALALLCQLRKPTSVRQLATALRCDVNTAGKAIAELRDVKCAKRHSKSKKTWTATPFGREVHAVL